MWYISGKHKSFHFQIKLRIESNWSRKSGQLAPRMDDLHSRLFGDRIYDSTCFDWS